jgi:hypothetical protein
MARGNQRDLAREKNLKKAAGPNKLEGNPLQRNAANSAALAEKVARTQAKAEEDARREAEDAARLAASGGAAAAPSLGLKKKKEGKGQGLDTLDLLDAGLGGGKKKGKK